MATVFEKFISILRNQYPDLRDFSDLPEKTRNLVADEPIELPLIFYKTAQETIQTIFAQSRTPERINFLREKLVAQKSMLELNILDHKPKNLSALMAYDFHFDLETMQTSLIEINTNASGYLFSDSIYRAFDIDPYASSHSKLKGLSPLEVLTQSFEREAERCLLRKARKIAIIDENVTQQKMYFEFLMYQNLFRQRGYTCEIFEAQNLPTGFDLVYNRHTDFFLSDTKVRSILEAFQSGALCLTPNPYEYLLLSHKERLVEFAADKLAPTLIPTRDVKNVSSDDLWNDRKNLFFKPKNLFGGKATYKGASITRKTFETVLNGDYIVQEYRPAGRQGDWKFDLRCYVYADEIQLVIGRLYQGQVTNFSTLGGGFAPVIFK